MPSNYATLPIVNKEERIIIDAKYLPILKRYKWYLPSGGHNPSPRPFTYDPDTRPLAERNKSGKRFVSLERALMRPKERQWVKHLNGNLLDCRKENMVFVHRKDDAVVRSLNFSYLLLSFMLYKKL